jgi:hypothetical protein
MGVGGLQYTKRNRILQDLVNKYAKYAVSFLKKKTQRMRDPYQSSLYSLEII